MKTTALTLALLAAATAPVACFAQQTSSTETNIGRLSMEELARKNQQGAAAVAAVKATPAPLSSADNALMMEVAMGGMMQLEVSRAAVSKATNDAVKMFAQAEVDEQTGLSAKLKEIAGAKGITLPSTPDAETQTMISRMQGLSGADFDRMYVQESGVNGHKKLDDVMSRVQKNASDASLRDLAKAAHPLVETHLRAAQDMMKTMGGAMSNR
jgi:putative membrane protein